MRVPPPQLARAMARQVRATLAELPEAPSAVRNEMLSIASTLRHLSAELEFGAEHARVCTEAAGVLQAELKGFGLDLPTDVPAILRAIESPDIASDKADAVFSALVDYLRTCNRSELDMYRRGMQASRKAP
ncbi:hypothetical protein [Ramlibacter sp.]|uniref:hypothetical protein n=1 Tax=Ramlibacter sp. TaxID=1917967 RepID=UPI003D09E8B1